NVGYREDLIHVALLTEKQNVIENSMRIRQPLGLRAVRAITDHQQAGFHFLPNKRKYFDDIFDSLDRPKIRDMNEDPLIWSAQLCRKIRVRRATIDVAVDEIRHHDPLALNLEFFKGAPSEVLGDRRYRVALFDAEARDRKIGPVITNDCNVGTMKR